MSGAQVEGDRVDGIAPLVHSFAQLSQARRVVDKTGEADHRPRSHGHSKSNSRGPQSRAEPIRHQQPETERPEKLLRRDRHTQCHTDWPGSVAESPDERGREPYENRHVGAVYAGQDGRPEKRKPVAAPVAHLQRPERSGHCRDQASREQDCAGVTRKPREGNRDERDQRRVDIRGPVHEIWVVQALIWRLTVEDGLGSAEKCEPERPPSASGDEIPENGGQGEER